MDQGTPFAFQYKPARAGLSGGCCRVLLVFMPNEMRDGLIMSIAYLTKLLRWGGVVVLTIALGLPAVAVQAGEITSQDRNLQYNVKSEWVEVSQGRVVGLFEKKISVRTRWRVVLESAGTENREMER